MKACIASSIEELQALLDDKRPKRTCITHPRGFEFEGIVKRAASLYEQEPIRIVCANQAEARRIDASNPGGNVDVVTVRDLALGIIADTRVQDAIGRRDRVLDDNEMDVLMEDMKVTGLKARRLREMTKFFFKSLSDGFASKQGWLVTAEEQRQFAILEENLEARQALLGYELSGKALEGLNAVSDAVEHLPTIIVDYGAMSTLSQKLALATSDGTYCVIGCPVGSPSAEEPYPDFAGLEALGADPEVMTVSIASQKAAASTSCSLCPTPVDEFSLVAERVDVILDSTKDDTVLVATPNITWSTYIKKHIAARDVECATLRDSRKVKGDPRHAESCGELKLRTLAKLHANRNDMVALRTWIGLGDWLLRSDAWLELMAWARERGMAVSDAIEIILSTPEDKRNLRVFHKIEAQLAELGTVLGELDEAQPEEVASVLEAHGMQSPRNVERTPSDTETLFERLLAEPQEPGPHRVTIATFDQCRGIAADHVFVTGMVNGFLPHIDALDDKHSIEQKQRALARDREQFNDLMAIARKETQVSLFEKDAAANAEKLPMDVSRIYQSSGTRMVKVNPSMFIAREKE